MHSTWYAESLLPPQPSPAPLRETATNLRNISFHRVLHHREHTGNFPSHSSRVFLFCNFYNYREHFNETGYLLLSTSLSPSGFAALAICPTAEVTVTLCLQHWLVCSWCPWSLAFLRRVGEGGTGEPEADTDLRVLFLSKLESLRILTPLLHHIPWFPYPVFL